MHFIIASGLLDVDPGLFFWIFITFASFIIFFTKFAWKPILGALEKRESSIKESMEAAEKAIKRAEQISRDNESALKQAETAAQKIRKEAVEEAEAIRADRMEKAKDEAAKLLEQARATIQAEKKKALEDLRNEVAELAVQSARIILESEIDESKNKKLVDSYIKNISTN
jgi:F-type H+-transporting ATPase subunit b